jgi:hypothetical protein
MNVKFGPLPKNGGKVPMLIRSSFISAVALAPALSIGFAPSVEALTMKECSAKYQAAKTAGTLSGQKWNDFRKT